MDFGIDVEAGAVTETQIVLDGTLLPGVGHVDASIFPAATPASVVVVATPGGGMSRRYFDLDIEGYSICLLYTSPSPRD